MEYYFAKYYNIFIFLDTLLPYIHERGVSIINLIAIRTKNKLIHLHIHNYNYNIFFTLQIIKNLNNSK